MPRPEPLCSYHFRCGGGRPSSKAAPRNESSANSSGGWCAAVSTVQLPQNKREKVCRVLLQHIPGIHLSIVCPGSHCNGAILRASKAIASRRGGVKMRESMQQLFPRLRRSDGTVTTKWLEVCRVLKQSAIKPRTSASNCCFTMRSASIRDQHIEVPNCSTIDDGRRKWCPQK